jgi:Uma2 family endonuclease
MPTARHKTALTPEQYLAAEKVASVRHELVAGQAREMAGASQVHNLIVSAFAAKLLAAVQAPWRVYIADMKVRVGDEFYYPDIVVSRERVAAEVYYLAEPAVIVEVLSPTTERRDRLEKRAGYRGLASLIEYAIISQEQASIELARRRGNNWEVQTYGGAETLRFESLALSLPVADLYRDVAETIRGHRAR